MSELPVPAFGDWYESIRITDEITLIREKYVAHWLRCNIWHVRGRNHDILIDSGMGLRPLKQEIASLADRPIKVISTHAHFDHIGGAYEFDCRLGHRLEEDIHRNPDGENTATSGFVRAETFTALPDQQFRVEDYKVTAAPLTGYLDEGDVVDLGDRSFQIFHMPGHSPGSIALLDAKNKTLFSGDLIYDGDLYDSVYHSDKEQYRESLQRLREFDVDVIHGGHDQSFGKQQMLGIIDNYLAGFGTLGDVNTWVENQL
jgi:glyoxylase-like metal-dependent hydrolase (beta-lactamase superfamily II)